MEKFPRSSKPDHVYYNIRGPVRKKILQLEEEGNKIFRLNIGNSAPLGFGVPDEILVDVIRNLPTSQGHRNSKGLYSAHKTIVHYYQTKGLLDVTVNDVYIGSGVSELIAISMQALLNDGDKILIPAPDYPLWTAAATLAGGAVRHYLYDEENNWLPNLADMKAKIMPKIKAVVVVNPNNPTGTMYSKEILLEIAKLARKYGLIIFADEIYDKILYGDAVHHHIAALAPDLLTVTFNDLSKAYHVTGFRQGWMILNGPKHHTKGYIEGLDILSSMCLCATIPMQHAIQTALGGYQSIDGFLFPGGRLLEQRNRAWELVNQTPGISCVRPMGALYMFPKANTEMYSVHDDMKFIYNLLICEKALFVQGTDFNWIRPDHFRIVTLPPVHQIGETMGKLERFLQNYRQQT